YRNSRFAESHTSHDRFPPRQDEAQNRCCLASEPCDSRPRVPPADTCSTTRATWRATHENYRSQQGWPDPPETRGLAVCRRASNHESCSYTPHCSIAVQALSPDPRHCAEPHRNGPPESNPPPAFEPPREVAEPAWEAFLLQQGVPSPMPNADGRESRNP